MSSKNRLLINSAFSVGQTIFSAIVLFFLYRYILIKLGSEQLGIWSLVLASTSVARLSDLGFSGAVVRFVAKNMSRGEEHIASTVVQTAAITIGICLAFIAGGMYFIILQNVAWFIPEHEISGALEILPIAVISLWFGMTASVFQSGLDGCQRMDIRNIILIVSNVFYVGLVLWLVPNYGLLGLAKGQLGQSIFFCILSWICLRRQMPSLPLFPWYWSKTKFKEMFGYALNFQIAGIFGLLFDPITKLLLSRYGGLSATAYYEMASQVIIKVRVMLISAFQSIVPVIAEIDNSDQQSLVEIYLKTYRILFFLVWPYYLAVFLLFPLISSLWIGHIEDSFILYGQILTIGWMISSLGLAAYFHNLATGRLIWNTYSQIMTVALNAALGTLLGMRFGAVGVIIASMLSMAISILFLIIVFHLKFEIKFSEMISRKNALPTVLSIIFATLGITIYIKSNNYFGAVNASILSFSVYVFLIFPVLIRHPDIASGKQKLILKLEKSRKKFF